MYYTVLPAYYHHIHFLDLIKNTLQFHIIHMLQKDHLWWVIFVHIYMKIYRIELHENVNERVKKNIAER